MDVLRGGWSAVTEAAQQVATQAAEVVLVAGHQQGRHSRPDSDSKNLSDLRKKVDRELGGDVLQMMEAYCSCISDKLAGRLPHAAARKGGLLWSLPLLPLLGSSNPTSEKASEMRDLGTVNELWHWMDFAMAAYGVEAPGATSDVEKVRKALQGRAEVRTAELPPRDPEAPPGHYVAVDYSKRTVVLGVRGPWSLADAILDSSGHAEPFEEYRSSLVVHKEFRHRALRVLRSATPALEEALESHAGFQVAVVGHSSGAGAAICCSLLLKKRQLPGNPSIKCFAYAPPPVISRASVESVEMICCVNGRDVIPHSSLANLFHLAREALAVDSLDLSCQERLRMIRKGHATPTSQEVQLAKLSSVLEPIRAELLRQPDDGRPAGHPLRMPRASTDAASQDIVELVIPGRIFLLEDPVVEEKPPAHPDDTSESRGGLGSPGSEATATTASTLVGSSAADQVSVLGAPALGREEARALRRLVEVDREHFRTLALGDCKRSLSDHFCSSYQEGLGDWKLHLERQAMASERAGVKPKQSCCSVQ